MPEIHDVAVTRTEYPHFGQPDPKDKNGEKLYIAVRMVYLNPEIMS